ncbi:MAG TPA: DUF58 domain-containing protein [Spirochaetia bacterium]|nr:DUF58 domain-containing protein [Spirochaetia bacterium]
MDILDILPRIKNFPLLSNKLIEGLFSGNYRSVFRGPGIEFSEVRDYVEGDDVRSIDWNVTARMDAPYTKTFKEEREIVLFLVIDVSASVRSGFFSVEKSETLSALASIFAIAAEANGDRVGAVFFSDRIEKWVPPRKGKKHVASLLHDMMFQDGWPKGRGSDLGAALRTVHESLKRRGICVVLSDFRTASGFKELSLIAKKHDVIACKVTDPSDREFPFLGSVELRDPEDGRTIYAAGGSRRYRRQYAEFWEMYNHSWEKECKRRGIDTLCVSTGDDPVAKLLAFMNRRKRR